MNDRKVRGSAWNCGVIETKISKRDRSAMLNVAGAMVREFV